MPSDGAIRTAAKAQGLHIKRNNLIAASLSGLALVCVSIAFSPYSTTSTRGFLFGLVAGLFYANGFEYCLHRFLLHSGHGIFSQQHMVHHTTWESPDAARYVNFSSNPWGVVGLFCANAVPFLVLQWIFHNGWVAGVFASFTLYYIAFEEIHWRTHIGRMAAAVAPAVGEAPSVAPRAWHGSVQCFLPIFDWLIEPISSARSRRVSTSFETSGHGI